MLEIYKIKGLYTGVLSFARSLSQMPYSWEYYPCGSSPITMEYEKAKRSKKLGIILRHIKTTHSYHIVDPSPWPLAASFGALMFTMGAVLYMHKFKAGFKLLITGFIFILFITYTWGRDIIREAVYGDNHTAAVKRGLRLGVVLFIISEIMLFFSFFWAFFHSSIAPVFNIGGVWPPKAITPINPFTLPLLNTFILLTSGASITWAHSALRSRSKKFTLLGLITTVFLSILFIFVQMYEYITAPFNISDGIYGSCFYMLTGLHGLHVILGTVALIVALIRTVLNHFTNTHHVGFEAALWYWHFVDVVWLFLYLSVYCWGNS